jgi:hypothetical protein
MKNGAAGHVLLARKPGEICMGNELKTLAFCASRSHIVAVR